MALVLATAALVVRCGDDDEGTQPATSDAYIEVLDWMLTQPAAVLGEACEEELVYIESIGPEAISLDVQVELIDHYDTDPDLRFIDTREEAVDETMPTAPVQSECVLIGLGPLPEGRQIEIRGEIYRELTDVAGYRFELGPREGSWDLLAEPTEVDPEGLIGEP